MKCAIMQPTYMPWAGYLNLMDQVDCFVYLDDAQFERSTWHNRNRILVNGTPAWLTVPVVRGYLGASILEVVVDDAAHWRRKHLSMLSQAYARSSHCHSMLEAARILITTDCTYLAELNITLLEALRERLGIGTPTLRSSSMGIGGSRTRRLVEILAALGATEYVTPPGALNYLEQDRFMDQCSAHLWVHDFLPKAYVQHNVPSFVSHLSILDVVAHLGWEGAANYIRPAAPTARLY